MRHKLVIALIFILATSFLMYSGTGHISIAEEGQSQSAQTGKIPAFPGAEGGGKWATGGRGGRIIEVTNLNDSGPGSLREAVDAKGPRIVVFKVSGTIELKNRLTVRNPDITIAGQTAPGDGICIKGATFGIEADNVIVRYIRARFGGKAGESDAMGSNGNNVIIDHCSISWSTDETFSVFGSNTTVQWCIISESLVDSSHSKGAHGYGGIWGGFNNTYHHNLLAQHSSRNPRFGVGSATGDASLKVYTINNVIYNWGFNSAYGADGDCYVNMINNYYKPGPNTESGVLSRIFDTINPKAKFYIAGNYVVGNSEVTADNWKGVARVENPESKLSQPVEMAEPVTTHSAEEAYKLVLENAGAILPKRDACDARVIADVINGTGRQINSEDEVGGASELSSAEPPADTDHDGMPDEWEKANGLDPHNPEDGYLIGNDGYTNVEKYLNSITTNGSKNPTIKIKSPENNATLISGKTYTIKAEASDSDGKIIKVEFFDGPTKLGEDTSKPYEFKWENVKEGTHFISALAVDDSGTKTQSSVLSVYVNDNNPIDPWVSQDIGKTAISGSSSLKDGVLTVKGNGKIGGKNDTFHYTYQKLSGDGEIVALSKFARPNKIEAVSGIMIRDSLNTDSPMAFLGMALLKNRTTQLVYKVRKANGENVVSGADGIDITGAPTYLKLMRQGNKITAYYSRNANDWKEVGSVECNLKNDVYIGFAIDSAQSSNKMYNYTRGEFSNISYKGNITPASKPQTGSYIFEKVDTKVIIGISIALILIIALASIMFVVKKKNASIKKQQ